MGPDVECMVAALLNAFHRRDLGKYDLQDPLSIHGLDEGVAGIDPEDAKDLIADALARHGAEKRPVPGCFRKGFPLDGKAEFGGQAEGPQDPQRVLPERLVGERPDLFVPDGLAPAEGIDEPGEITVHESIERQRHGRKREIADGKVAFDAGSPDHGEIEDQGFVSRPDDDPLGHLVGFVLAQGDSRCARPFGKTGCDTGGLGREDDIHIGNGKPHEAILDGSPRHVEARLEFQKNMQIRSIAREHKSKRSPAFQHVIAQNGPDGKTKDELTPAAAYVMSRP